MLKDITIHFADGTKVNIVLNQEEYRGFKAWYDSDNNFAYTRSGSSAPKRDVMFKRDRITYVEAVDMK